MIEEIKTLLLEFKFQEARKLASDMLKTVVMIVNLKSLL